MMMRVAAGLAGLLIVALLGLYYSITAHLETKAELQAALARIENMKLAQEIDRVIENMDDDEFGTDLDHRLSGERD